MVVNELSNTNWKQAHRRFMLNITRRTNQGQDVEWYLYEGAKNEINPDTPVVFFIHPEGMKIEINKEEYARAYFNWGVKMELRSVEKRNSLYVITYQQKAITMKEVHDIRDKFKHIGDYQTALTDQYVLFICDLDVAELQGLETIEGRILLIKKDLENIIKE